MIESNCNRYSLQLVHNWTFHNVEQNTSEFSSIYHEIVNISRTAPLYLIYPTDKLQALALQIKDLSLQLSNKLKQYFKTSPDNPLKKLKLVIPPSDCVSVKLLIQPQVSKTYKIKIKQVAKGQQNRGNYVPKRICPFTAQTYAFSIQSDSETLDFEIQVKNNSTNEEILTQMSSLINRTSPNVEAELIQDNSNVCLVIEAKAHRRNVPARFTITDATPNGLISFYGLNKVTTEPSSSDFTVNDELFHSFGVAFTIDDLFEMTLLKKCPDMIHIAFEPDSSIISEEIKKLQATLNHLLVLAHNCKKNTLELELVNFLTEHRHELAKIGIELDDSNLLFTNQEQLEHSIRDSSLVSFFSEGENFSQELLDQTHDISIDPMKYLPSKVVSYKDHTKINYPNPYQLSEYSGFLFTNYC